MSSLSSTNTLPLKNCPGKYNRLVLSKSMTNFSSFLDISSGRDEKFDTVSAAVRSVITPTKRRTMTHHHSAARVSAIAYHYSCTIRWICYTCIIFIDYKLSCNDYLSQRTDVKPSGTKRLVCTAHRTLATSSDDRTTSSEHRNTFTIRRMYREPRRASYCRPTRWNGR